MFITISAVENVDNLLKPFTQRLYSTIQAVDRKRIAVDYSLFSRFSISLTAMANA